ncbi:transposase [Nocardia pseudovaccinii]|uniref:transposase n=1 Tax=Nocardia pseudovaccinii TaxID=189540 RepID=UPI001FDECC63|nr:transposase [Nocardia pseudovaccinii]
MNRWFPSSQLCSICGVIDGRKPLSVRLWACRCGAVHDRDRNAANNILAAGRAERLNACGDGVSPGLVLAPGSEAGTHREDREVLVGILDP